MRLGYGWGLFAFASNWGSYGAVVGCGAARVNSPEKVPGSPISGGGEAGRRAKFAGRAEAVWVGCSRGALVKGAASDGVTDWVVA